MEELPESGLICSHFYLFSSHSTNVYSLATIMKQTKPVSTGAKKSIKCEETNYYNSDTEV